MQMESNGEKALVRMTLGSAVENKMIETTKQIVLGWCLYDLHSSSNAEISWENGQKVENELEEGKKTEPLDVDVFCMLLIPF